MAHLPDIKDLLVTLDIGSSKITVLVGEVNHHAEQNNNKNRRSKSVQLSNDDPQLSLQVIAIGQVPAHGLKRGIVTNIDSITDAIERALSQAESIGACQIHDVYVTIGGHHIQSFESHGMMALKHQQVNIEDIQQVIEIAKAISLPVEQKILHILTEQFILDGNADIHDPLGMKGHRLEAKVNIITGQNTAIANLLECLHRCHLHENEIVIQGLASSTAILTHEEKENGVCLLDIGAGTTDIVVFSQNAVRYTTVIPVAGDHVTGDIATALTITRREAEQVKLEHGCCLLELVSPSEVIEIMSLAHSENEPITMYRQNLVSVIEPRVEELFHLVFRMLEDHDAYHLIQNGIVLTGGTALLPGIVELAQSIFNVPVRIGIADYRGINDEIIANPQNSASYGLLLRAFEHYQHHQDHLPEESPHPVFHTFERIKDWFKRNF